MSLPFQISQIQTGAPESINKILGNGLIPFLALDGNLYLVDVRGHVSPLSDYSGGSGIVAYINYISSGGETQIPNYVDKDLMSDSYVMVFMEGSLLTSGNGSDEYADTSLLGYITLNFPAPPDNRFTVIGFGKSGSSGGGGGFSSVVNLQITQPQSNSQLNALYPDAGSGSVVFCPNIIGGGLMYVYLGNGTWSNSLLTLN